jgi:stage V sporulation protein S
MEEEKAEKPVKPTIKDGRAIFRVKSSTNVSALAGAVAKCLDDGYVVEVGTIGAGALNQAFKGIAKAGGFLETKGQDLIVRPKFGEVMIDGEKRTKLVQNVSLG